MSEDTSDNFYPVDGLRGRCVCGEYIHYIFTEDSTTVISCKKCGRKIEIAIVSEFSQQAGEER